MIVFFYLAKELLSSWLAITGILLLIIVSGRFIKYLEQAVSGQIKAELLFAIMWYRLPGFLEMIIPLAFFMAILFSYGRLYIDNEMVILTACGMSREKLLFYTQISASVVFVSIGLISLWITPLGSGQVERIFMKQDAMTDFDNVISGRFQKQDNLLRTTYVENIVNNNSLMKNIFIAENYNEMQSGKMVLVTAESGYIQRNKANNKRYLMLSDGFRYELSPGDIESKEMKFDSYGLLMPDTKPVSRPTDESVQSVFSLIESNKSEAYAELQWRISLPMMIPIIVFISLPLSVVNSRKGRYMQLLPGLLVYLLYLGSIITAKGMIEDNKISPLPGTLVIHAGFLIIGILMFYWQPLLHVFKGKIETTS